MAELVPLMDYHQPWHWSMVTLNLEEEKSDELKDEINEESRIITLLQNMTCC